MVKVTAREQARSPRQRDVGAEGAFERRAEIAVLCERSISVSGFKSLEGPYSCRLRPLTLLAGANSSGKSSVMQPLLLLKQTLDAAFDPGALLLFGPHVQFARPDELLTQNGRQNSAGSFEVRLNVEYSWFPEEAGFADLDEEAEDVRLQFRKASETAFELQQAVHLNRGVPCDLHEGMTSEELARAPGILGAAADEEAVRAALADSDFSLHRERCYFVVHQRGKARSSKQRFAPRERRVDLFSRFLGEALLSLLHVPGIRRHATEPFPLAAVGERFPGPFDAYTASVILTWQESGSEKLSKLAVMLEDLGLTSEIEARQPDATQVELWVRRSLSPPKVGRRDWVRLTHVGLGVSQVLPVLVALLLAKPQQIVYLEQPELHLHPRAQAALARYIAEAANRDVMVIVETHSALLLRSLQTLIASGELHRRRVILHWFERDEKGLSKVTSTEPAEDGSYGDWPEDFGDVEMEANESYLDAVERQRGIL